MTQSKGMTRRTLLGTSAAVAAPLLLRAQAPRPNFLIMMTEDITANVHCFGDDYSITPNLDRLSQRGCVFTNAWSNAPVCAPAKSTLWSGLYATATGAEHMRSLTRLPADMKMFPGYLREAGYYCSMNGGNDLNLEIPPGTFDFATQGPGGTDQSGKGHWRGRTPGQPFLAFFDDFATHESQIRAHSQTNTHFLHDPSRFRVPAYHPDVPEVRRDWAQYYDNITTVDKHIQARLQELEDDGLSGDTIVFFISDHGAGMPRSKRFPYNSGLNVPILAVIPEKFRHLAPQDYVSGGKSQRLIGHIDFAPSILSAAGVKAPSFYQGHSYLGPQQTAPRTYSFGFRGRMDERYDLMRTARDQRHVYIRNYYPHKIYGQHVAYMWGTKTTEVWERLYQAGALKPPQTFFWETKPAEELYDLENDPDEVKNLAAEAAHKAVLDRFRKAQEEHTRRICDIGLLTEAEFHRRAAEANLTPYEVAQDTKRYPMKKVLSAAELASSGRPGVTAQLLKLMDDADSGVRYWGVTGVLMRGAGGGEEGASGSRQGAGRCVPQRTDCGRRGARPVWRRG
jgi:arylsulfatase A-like enzyme